MITGTALCRLRHMLGMPRRPEMCIQRDCGENTVTISAGKDMMLKEFLGDL